MPVEHSKRYYLRYRKNPGNPYRGLTDGMDYFKGMQCIDEPLCERGHAEEKISELWVAKKRMGVDVTKGLKLLAALHLAR